MTKIITTKLIGIACRQKSRAPMEALESVTISQAHGLEGDCRGKPGKRQVTVLSAESWSIACDEIGAQLSWLTRRANLLIEGGSFSQSDVGKVICVGAAKLKITRETDSCRRMDQAHNGLKKALRPDCRGGVCCTVLEGAVVSMGDEVVLLD